jgi:hypothetical protein
MFVIVSHPALKGTNQRERIATFTQPQALLSPSSAQAPWGCRCPPFTGLTGLWCAPGRRSLGWQPQVRGDQEAMFPHQPQHAFLVDRQPLHEAQVGRAPPVAAQRGLGFESLDLWKSARIALGDLDGSLVGQPRRSSLFSYANEALEPDHRVGLGLPLSALRRALCVLAVAGATCRTLPSAFVVWRSSSRCFQA